MPEELQSRASPEPLTFLRALVGPTLFIGGWQLMSASFIAGVCIAYAGFLICLAEIIWEPSLLRRSSMLQVLLIGALLFFVDLFTITVVLTPAPVVFNSLWTESTHVLPETGGIEWKPFFAELETTFTNPRTDSTYDDLNVLLRPDRLVASVSQLSNLPEVSFEDRYGVSMHAWVEDLSKTDSNVTNQEFVGTDAGYKVHCAHIPPNASLRIVMAIVELKKPVPNPQVLPPVSSEGIFTAVNFTDKDGSKSVYWFGRKSYIGMFVLQPAKPTKITVSGSYMGGHRLRKIEKDVALEKPVILQ